MNTPARFSDGQYKNWLKCSQSLIIMKEALHDYIDNEVKKLHGDITHKVSSIPCGSSTGNQCGSCSSKNIKLKHGNWYINCKNSICDKWLHQILAVHDDPQNPTINWKNADISKWPTNCYQVAKIFMPKGQDKTTKMPEDLDAPAVLSLMKYCNWFRKDLPNTQIMSDLIDIRNKTLHSGDLRLADGNKDSWIDLMIQLLSDLNIHGDAQTQLQMLKREDVDINFRETEIRVFQRMATGLVTDFTTVKGDMVSLQDSQSELSNEMKRLRDNTTVTTTKVDTVENDVNEMGKSLDELKIICDKMVSFFDKNPDIHETEITETFRNIGTDVKDLQHNLFRVETELKARVSALELQQEGTKKNQEATKQQMEEIKRQHEETKQQVEETKKNQEETKQLVEETKKNQEETKQQMEEIKRQHEETEQQVGETKKNQEETKQLVEETKKNQEETKQLVEETKKNQEEIKEKVEGVERRLAVVEEQKKNEQLLFQNLETPRKRRPETDGLKQLKNQTEDKLDTLRKLQCIPTKQADEAKKLLERKRSIVIKGNPGEGKTTMALHLIDNEMYRDRRVVLYCPQDWKTVDTDWVDVVIVEDILGHFDLDFGLLQEWMVYLPTIQEHLDAGKLRVIITTRDDILSKVYYKLGSLKLFSDDLSLKLSSERLSNLEKMSILNRELQRHERNMKEDDKEKCIANFSGFFGFPQCCSLFAGDSKLFDRRPEFFRSPEKFFVANISDLEATRFLSLAFLFCNGKIYEENLSPETMPESSKDLLMELASHLHISKKEASIVLLRDAYDSFLDLYVFKSMSCNFSLESAVKKPCIWFIHATVCEAVGEVLGDRCLEMVVKCGNSEYLYQRTYTAEAKDGNSQNVFIPVSVYGLLAERMVYDVVKRRLVGSVVKHSSLKQYYFLKKLKCQLHKGNAIKDFFMAVPNSVSVVDQDLSEGTCITFMQFILQSDEDVVRLVYDEFLEFLECAHNNNSSGCWQCEEKQTLLELSLYYHHFHIADKLITMKARYTHLSLCNAARHGDLRRVQIILETIRTRFFSAKCKEAQDALCKAYISGNQSMIEFLLKEGIILDSWHVVDAVKHGNMNVLMKVVEHLKCHNKWKPDEEGTSWVNSYHPTSNRIPYFTALCITYSNEKFDMADYLQKNNVKVSLYTLLDVSHHGSQKAVARVIQNLKDTCNWDPECDEASQALENAYRYQKYDVCHLLVQEGVSLTMKNLPGVTMGFKVHESLESVKKAITHLKDSKNWDPRCGVASRALENAFSEHKHDVSDLLIQEGVSLTMKNLPIVFRCVSSESVKKAIEHLKDTDNWDPKCDSASEVLKNAYRLKKDDLGDLLVQEGVLVTKKNLPSVLHHASVVSVKKAIQHLKEADNWDPKCEDVSNALENAYRLEKFDLCDLLVQEGVSLTKKNLPSVLHHESVVSVKKAIQHLKEADNWDPKCDDATEALENAYRLKKFDLCDLLVQEGVSLTKKNLSSVLHHKSVVSVKKAIQHLKEADNWDPKCDDATEALENAYRLEKFDLCDLLVQEGVSLTKKNLSSVLHHESVVSVEKAIQHLKEADNWDPKCDDATEALENAYRLENFDLCDLLVQEGVSLTKKNLSSVLHHESVVSVEKAIQHLKEADNWDPKCDDATEALENAYRLENFDLCDLLVQEGVSLTKKNLPKCDDASKTFENAYSKKRRCDLQ